ncbi:MAG: hypothetical protein IPM71_02415 [Bacteroidota bacterium]|nr:MAG: hypothetical protein IPM71_02415 [Bacteroidota bacterium]
MQRMKFRFPLLFILLALFATNTFGQNDYNDELFRAYLSKDRDLWLATIKSQELSKTKNTFNNQLALINSYYGYVGWLLAEKKTDQAELYLDKGWDLLEQLSGKYPENATLMAYQGAWLGFEITMNSLKTVYLGPKSMKFINQSLEKDPDNIQGLIEKGNAYYFMPASFGGDKLKTLQLFKQALSLMKSSLQHQTNWQYLQLQARVGIILSETGQNQKAIEHYQSLLKSYPDFIWVRDELYPDLLSKMSPSQ